MTGYVPAPRAAMGEYRGDARVGKPAARMTGRKFDRGAQGGASGFSLLRLIEQLRRCGVAGRDAQGGFQFADGVLETPRLQVLLTFAQVIVELAVAQRLRRFLIVRPPLEGGLIRVGGVGVLLLLVESGAALHRVLI